MDPEDSMFAEVLAAIDHNQRARARDLLTRLIKANPGQSDYWVWMSAVVDTPKEQIYCLKEALRVDPQNKTAQRGLAILGVLPPDEKWIIPLSLQQTNKPDETRSGPKISSWSMAPRWFQGLIIGAGVLLVAGILLVVSRFLPIFQPAVPTSAAPIAVSVATSSPLPKITPTFVGPAPLWASLQQTYTPTPVYISTLHPRSEAFRSAQRAFQRGEWDKSVNYLQQVITLEPTSADLYYQIGEVYRAQKNYSQALEFYNQAAAVNSQFAPSFLGRALTLEQLSPEKIDDIRADLNTAIKLDANLVDAVLELAALNIRQHDSASALTLLEQAQTLAPHSALVHFYRAQALLDMGNPREALAEVQQANQMDITILPVYRLIGQSALAAEKPVEARHALMTYTTYEENDAQAYAWLGMSYLSEQQAEQALEAFTRSLKLDDRQYEVHLQRALLYLEQQKSEEAILDLKAAGEITPRTFAVFIGLAEAYLQAGKSSEAYQQAVIAENYAKTDEEKARVYYWRALSLEKLNKTTSAQTDWKALMALPDGSAPEQWLLQAQEHLSTLSPATATITLRPPTETRWPTRTPVITDTRQPSPTPRGSTPRPSATATPTP